MTPPLPLPRLRRREWLCAMAALSAPLAHAAEPPAPPSHEPFGRVEPARPAAALALLRDDAQPTTLPQLLRGHITAVQLMFTGCSAICPIQGALFAELARRLPDAQTRLLSLSIDPLGDDPRALRAWLTRFDAPRTWRAAAPRVQDVDTLLDFLRGRSDGFDRHNGQIFLFDRAARLIFRTPEMPPVSYVAELLGAAASKRG